MFLLHVMRLSPFPAGMKPFLLAMVVQASLGRPNVKRAQPITVCLDFLSHILLCQLGLFRFPSSWCCFCNYVSHCFLFCWKQQSMGKLLTLQLCSLFWQKIHFLFLLVRIFTVFFLVQGGLVGGFFSPTLQFICVFYK